MAIIPRGTSFQANFSAGGTRYRRSFPTHDEARRWEAEVRTRAARGETVDARTRPKVPTTLEELRDSTHDRWWKGTKGEAMALINANNALKFFGPTRQFATLTSHDLDRYVTALKEYGYSRDTAVRKLAALSRMLTHAQEQGWIAHTLKMPRLRLSDFSPRRLSLEEEARVLAYFDQNELPEMKDLVVLLLDSGLHLREVLDLRWGNLDAGVVSVAKSNTPSGVRSVPMTDRVKEMLNRKHAGRGEIDPDAFVWSIDIGNVNYYWQRMREVLGFDKDAQFEMKLLRDTFGCRRIRTHEEPHVVQRLMGFKLMSAVLRYYPYQDEEFHKEANERQHAKRLVELSSQARNPDTTVPSRLGDLYRELLDRGLTHEEIDHLTWEQAVARVRGTR